MQQNTRLNTGRIAQGLAAIMFCLLTAHIPAADAPLRSAADIQRDINSKPFAVLEFADIKPGWQVMDMFAGNGYYAELLAQAVGPEGKVYLHNNQAYMAFASKLNERLKNNRLPNVEVYVREVEDINLPSEHLDLVLLVKTYHDVYFTQSGWTVTADPLFKTIYRVLKPGGQLLIIDHHGAPGSGNSRAQDLHRIEAQFAKKDISSRGFTWVDESTILSNSSDPLNISVFDPEVTGKTSRFVFKFLKQ
jgi:predicted methyltransferase